jgi:alkylated DNA repair dioxygenase AlkB
MTITSNPRAIAAVPGLFYVPGYLNHNEQQQLVSIVDQQPWLTDLKRRVQHYGYRYSYSHRSLDASMSLGPLPTWAFALARRLNQDGYTAQIPDQLIVNEYEPGQGISAHIDCVPCFDATVMAISLGSSCTMVFKQPATREQVSILLEPGSLTVMTDDARHVWQHSIPARKSDTHEEQKYLRQRRLSLTFRVVLK